MKYLFYICCLALFTGACTKPKNLNPSGIILGDHISNRQPVADGTTTLDITVTIDAHADSAKRSIVFRASTGIFLPAKDTTITIQASYENKLLIARTKFQVPIISGMVHFYFYPQGKSSQKDLILRDSLQVMPSVPASLVLTPSASAVKMVFGSEISLSALLQNSLKAKVSSGTKVLFEDIYPDGKPVGGIFRATRDTTDSTSTAVTNYSLGNVPAGPIFIRCTYLNADSRTAVHDSCIINVIPN